MHRRYFSPILALALSGRSDQARSDTGCRTLFVQSRRRARCAGLGSGAGPLHRRERRPSACGSIALFAGPGPRQAPGPVERRRPRLGRERFDRLDVDGADSARGSARSKASSTATCLHRAGRHRSGLINAVSASYQIRTVQAGLYVVEQIRALERLAATGAPARAGRPRPAAAEARRSPTTPAQSTC